jgi:hypothetical protein
MREHSKSLSDAERSSLIKVGNFFSSVSGFG